MLDENQIRDALLATRVIPLTAASFHGPLGLEQLAEEVRRLGAEQTPLDVVSRPIPLRTETWQKLDEVAHHSSGSLPGPATASDIAAAIIEHYVAGLPQ